MNRFRRREPAMWHYILVGAVGAPLIGLPIACGYLYLAKGTLPDSNSWPTLLFLGLFAGAASGWRVWLKQAR